MRRGQYKGVFARETDAAAIARMYAGTAGPENIRVDAQGTFTEYFDVPFVQARYFEKSLGKYLSTTRVAIRYSKKGLHIFPTNPYE